MEQDLLCRDCGRPKDESMLDESDPRAPKYEAEAIACRSCAEIQAAANAASEQNQGHGMEGWKWLVKERANGASRPST